MNISIIGSGVVGSRIGKGFKELGHKVIFYDINTKTIKSLSKEHLATIDLKFAIMKTDISFICVPTPFDNFRGFDASYIRDVITKISEILLEKGSYHIIVIKSTVQPTTTENIILPLLKKNKNVGVCVNPEFLTEISESWTKSDQYFRGFFNEDRIVIGAENTNCGNLLQELYTPLNIPIYRTNLVTAEMIKYASNAILATKISFWNEIFLLCENFAIDGHLVSRIVGEDPRIGKYGTINGKAYGGKCLPKDIKALIEIGEEVGADIPILKSVDYINEKMKLIYGVRE